MKQILAFLRGLAANPKTTATGIAAIAGAAVAVSHDHSQLANPMLWSGLLAGIGLLLAPDAAPPSDPPSDPK